MCSIGFRPGYMLQNIHGKKNLLLAYSRALQTVLTVWIFKTELSKITGKSDNQMTLKGN